jgi:hypothetical protein
MGVVARWTVPKAENVAREYVARHTASMSIRYNR